MAIALQPKNKEVAFTRAVALLHHDKITIHWLY